MNTNWGVHYFSDMKNKDKSCLQDYLSNASSVKIPEDTFWKCQDISQMHTKMQRSRLTTAFPKISHTRGLIF